ncbi:MAG: NAD(P)/FAD-dependent oxidoreductase [Nocardioidaceae bacterium]
MSPRPAPAEFDVTDGPWDLVVIGGGTAGIVSAKTAVGLGARVLMVERDRFGGDCLWTGCVPSKALLGAAHLAADARDAARFGVHADQLRIDFRAVMTYVHDTIEAIEPDDSPEAMNEAGVHVAYGTARFTGPDTVLVGGDVVRFRQALIATGSAPILPPVPGLTEAEPWTSDTIWDIKELPDRLVVLGGGSIGCELGQAFARLGAQVTIVEGADRLLPREDVDAARILTSQLADDGVAIRTGAQAVAVTTGADDIDEGDERADEGSLRLDDGTVLEYDELLVAVGRRPRTADLGLERVDVRVDDRGYVAVNRRLQTSNPRIWAAGDVTAFSQFTHTAGMHGSIAAGNAVLGLRRTIDEHGAPRVTFTQPEVAAVGVTGDQVSAHMTVETTHHDDVDRATAEGRTTGFSRLVLDRKGRVVGGTIVGPRAGESLAEVVLATRLGLRTRDIAGATHPYPTYSDGVWNASIAHVRSQLMRTPARRVAAALSRGRRWWVSR